jgi:serine/threonine protein kinase
MDFGIAHEARHAVSKLTNAEATGTLAYMPPEQEMGQVSSESDLFALAVVAYEALVGRLPFPGPNFLAQKQAKSFTAPSRTLPPLPAALDAVFDKAFDPDPELRHATALEFARALAAALAAPSV